MTQYEYKRRICYRDTDCAGIVYHANYLGLMEEARGEWYCQAGLLAHSNKPAFAVRHLEIDYLKPAMFGDYLRITGEYVAKGRAGLIAHQHIYNDASNVLLCKANILLVHLDNNGKPCRIPEQILKEIL